MDDKAKEKLKEGVRTAALAAMQLFEGVGGPAAQVISHLWVSPAQKRQADFCEKLQQQLDSQGRSLEWLAARVASSESTATLAVDMALASAKAGSEEERLQLARMFAASLDMLDPEIENVRFLLNLWESLDGIQKTVLIAIGTKKSDRLREDFPDVFGSGYFHGVDHQARMAKDDLHRKRIDRMLSLGLIRPIKDELWKQGKVTYEFKNFWLTATATQLVKLLDGNVNVSK